MQTLLNVIEKISEWVGKVVSFLILPMVLIIVYTVIMRYVFHASPSWGFEVSIFLYGLYFMLSGAYCLKLKAHVNVDILPQYLPVFGQRILELLSSIVIIIVCLTLVFHGYKMAWQSTLILERSIHQSAFNPQIWWFKWVIPISAALVLLQSFGELIAAIQKLRGKGVQS